MVESRVRKSLLNARVNLIFYVLALILSFFSRRIFLDCLGSAFIGLIGTLQNLLGFLNLAELGIGAAIGYVLYKPIFDNDYESINEILSVMGYVYRKIGIIIFASGIILSFFLPLIFPEATTGLNLNLAYFAFYSLLISSLLGYFINYRQNLLGADQRNYIVTACFQTVNMIKIIIQLVVAAYTRNPFYWVFIELIFGVIYSIILNKRINKTYPWLKSKISMGKILMEKYPAVFSKSKQLFIHQINAFAQFQLTPLLTYAFLSLNLVTCLGNYTLLLDKVTGLLNTVIGSTTASVGNLIAEKNSSKTERTFWTLLLIRSMLAATVFFGCYVGFGEFIKIWLGNEYVLSDRVLFLLLLKIYILIISGTFFQFLYGFGLFNDIWAAIAESVSFVIFAILGGYLYSLEGILAGGVLSVILIQAIWKPYYLFKKGFNKSVKIYWVKTIKVTMLNVFIITTCVWAIRNSVFCFSQSSVITVTEITGLSCLFFGVIFSIYNLLFKNIRDVTKSLILKILKRTY